MWDFLGDHRTFCESFLFLWPFCFLLQGLSFRLDFLAVTPFFPCREFARGGSPCRNPSGIVPGQGGLSRNDRPILGGRVSAFRRSLRHSFLLRHCLSRRDYPCKALLDNPVMGLPHCINPVRGISAPRTTNVVRRACRRSHNIVNHLFSAGVYSEYTFVFLGIKFLLGQAESRAIVLFGIELAILEFPQ